MGDATPIPKLPRITQQQEGCNQPKEYVKRQCRDNLLKGLAQHPGQARKIKSKPRRKDKAADQSADMMQSKRLPMERIGVMMSTAYTTFAGGMG